jgi:hypothetical protein
LLADQLKDFAEEQSTDNWVSVGVLEQYVVMRGGLHAECRRITKYWNGCLKLCGDFVHEIRRWARAEKDGPRYLKTLTLSASATMAR